MEKFIVKQGDTFTGFVEVTQDRSAVPPTDWINYFLAATVKADGSTFTDFISFTNVGPARWAFTFDTSYCPVGTCYWDIEITCDGQVISVPYETNMILEVRNGVQ